MTLTFKYKKIERPEPLPPEDAPAIPLTLIGPKEKIDVIGLIDSGADFSFIPQSTAEILGLDLSAKPEEVGGVGGSIEAVKTRMRINISKGNENYTFPVEVYVGIGPIKDDFPILIGRNGFFYNFKITFIESQKRIYLKKDIHQ